MHPSLACREQKFSDGLSLGNHGQIHPLRSELPQIEFASRFAKSIPDRAIKRNEAHPVPAFPAEFRSRAKLQILSNENPCAGKGVRKRSRRELAGDVRKFAIHGISRTLA